MAKMNIKRVIIFVIALVVMLLLVGAFLLMSLFSQSSIGGCYGKNIRVRKSVEPAIDIVTIALRIAEDYPEGGIVYSYLNDGKTSEEKIRFDTLFNQPQPREFIQSKITNKLEAFWVYATRNQYSISIRNNLFTNTSIIELGVNEKCITPDFLIRFKVNAILHDFNVSKAVLGDYAIEKWENTGVGTAPR